MHPMNTTQHTLKHGFLCQGVGLHTGQLVSITVEPAPADHGLVFERQDLPHRPRLEAYYSSVTEMVMCSKLSLPTGEAVGTIEHLLAAFAACQIDNALIGVDGPEIPLMDGSALPFITLIEAAGMQNQFVKRPWIKIQKTVRVTHQDRWVELSPSDNSAWDLTFDFKDRQGLGSDHLVFQGNIEDFKQQIANARTFGFYEEAQQLHAKGLSLGASLENVVVIDQGQIMNPGGLRYKDEFVRHKMLDALGDLYLAGAPLQAKYSAYNGGHHLHFQLLKALFEDTQAWSWG